MKKILVFLLIGIIILNPLFLGNVEAQTLGEIKKDLQDKQDKLSDTQNQKELTEQEISEVNASIASTEKQISQTYIDIDNLQQEIDKMNKDIDEKKEEVKKILNYVQVSSGESTYLEYIFGATSFTDFIYRVAVSEQLTAYNDKLVDEYNDMIKQNQQKQKEIEAKRVTLGEQQVELNRKKEQLGTQLDTIASTSLSIEDEIKEAKEMVALYESMGCKDNENVSTCGRSVLPAGTAFYRPLESSYITSEWGTRYYLGKSFHEGIDMGASEGTPVYAIGNGMVATIIPRNSCGGNMVVVHHNINGRSYTSVYAHLLSINVGKGQTVTKNTIVGYSGGQSTKSYDRCTGGAHLHLTVATGLYGVDYSSWSLLNYTYSINPRNAINFPAGTYNRWNDRITAY